MSEYKRVTSHYFAFPHATLSNFFEIFWESVFTVGKVVFTESVKVA